MNFFRTHTFRPLPSFEFKSSWALMDRNVYDITNSQYFDPITRNYDSDNLASHALWSVWNNRYSLRVDWQDSENCLEGQQINNRKQDAEALVEITVTKNETIVIEWEGIGEKQDPDYEKMDLFINDELISRGHAPGGNLQCEMGPIVSEWFEDYENGYELTPGDHTIKIVATTNDGLYHVGAYYQFFIYLKQ